MYMPKSAVPIQPNQPTSTPSQTPTANNSAYMPKSAIPMGDNRPTLLQNAGTDAGDILKGVAQLPKYAFNKFKDMGDPTKPNPMKAAGVYAPLLDIGKDLIGGTINEYNELAGRPLEGGDWWGRAKDRAYEKPVTTALDLIPLVGAGKKMLGIGNNLDDAARASSVVDDVGRPPPGGGVIDDVAKPSFRQRLANKADDVTTKGIGNPAKQRNLKSQTGRSVGSFIDEYDLYDRSPSTAKAVKRGIGSQFDDAARQSNKTTATQNVIKAFDDKIDEISQGSRGGVVADKTMKTIEELQRRKQMFVDYIGDNQSVSLDDLTEFRRNIIDPDVPKSQFGLSPQQAGSGAGVKKSRDLIRETTIDIAPELEKLGMDYKMAIGVEKILESHVARLNNRQLLNFTKLGSAGVGAFLKGIPGAAGGFLMEQFVNSPMFVKVISKTLRKLAGADDVVRTAGVVDDVARVADDLPKNKLFSQMDETAQTARKIESTVQPQSSQGIFTSKTPPKQVPLATSSIDDAGIFSTKKDTLFSEINDAVEKYPVKSGNVTPKNPKLSAIVDDALEIANQQQTAFAKKVSDLAESLGKKHAVGDVKGKDRVVEKLVLEEGEQIANIKDMNRGVIFIDDFGKGIDKIIESTKKHLDYDTIPDDMKRIVDSRADTMYKKLIVNFPGENGQLTELQLTTPQMWKAKMELGGDKLYMRYRSMPDLNTPDALHLKSLMQRLYTQADKGLL